MPEANRAAKKGQEQRIPERAFIWTVRALLFIVALVSLWMMVTRTESDSAPRQTTLALLLGVSIVGLGISARLFRFQQIADVISRWQSGELPPDSQSAPDARNAEPDAVLPLDMSSADEASQRASQQKIRGQQLASYTMYPISEGKEGRLEFSAEKANKLARQLVDESNSYAAYELLVMIEILERHAGQTLDLERLEPVCFDKLRTLVPGPTRVKYDTEREGVILAVSNIIHGLGAMFRNCGIEFVLHDARSPLFSIVCIENSISERKLADSNTNFGLKMIRMYAEYGNVKNFTSYRLRLKSKIIKSSTLPILDRSRNLVAVFCVNMDISWESDLRKRRISAELHELLEGLCWTNKSPGEETGEKLTSNRSGQTSST